MIPVRRPTRPLLARRTRTIRPRCEALDGRLLLSYSPLDPSFHSAQPVVDLGGTATAATSLNDPTGLAVQPDGRIVVVGTIDGPNRIVIGPGVAIRRYNADGTPDTTFGTGGEVNLTLPANQAATSTATSANVLIQPDGRIVFTAVQQQQSSVFGHQELTPLDTVVVRLNADGSADTRFGTGGEVVLASEAADLTHLALQSDGRIVLAGTVTPASATPSAVAVGQPTTVAGSTVAVTRLNADGSVDSTFNTGAFLEFNPTVFGRLSDSEIAGVAVAPNGRIDLGWTVALDSNDNPTAGNAAFMSYEVAAINPTGGLDSTFGTGGVVIDRPPHLVITQPALTLAAFYGPYRALAVEADGRIVLTGTNTVRLNTNGSPDSSFARSASPIGTASALLIQPDGRIVIGGTQGATSTSSTAFAAVRYTASGALDPSFGPNGRVEFTSPDPSTLAGPTRQVTGLALSPNGEVVAAGVTIQSSNEPIPTFGTEPILATQLVLARLRVTNVATGLSGNDYDGDGRTDLAAELTQINAFAVRQSTGGDQIQGFGSNQLGGMVLASGDYDGDGRTDLAAYFPALGVLVYRPSGGGADVDIRFGPTGLGQAIPVPGDYNGDGRTDVALFLPATSTFIVDPSGGGAPYAVQFGTSGSDPSLPVPGDYDGSGRTEFAVYIPNLGVWAYRPAGGGADVVTPFGPAADPYVIPVPGDYDGDGRTDMGLYLRDSGVFAIRPSAGRADQYTQFGTDFLQAISIPVPGDYDGDGRTDLAVYLPGPGVFADRPSGGGNDQLAPFGPPGNNGVMPAAEYNSPIVVPPPVLITNGAASDLSPSVAVPLVPDEALSLSSVKKRSSTAG